MDHAAEPNMLEHPPQQRSLDSIDTARVALKAFFNIAQRWRLTSAEQAVLLGITEGTCTEWRSGQVDSALNSDTLVRLGHVLTIYGSLQILLPDTDRADAWVHQPNNVPMFGGEPAIRRMLRGGVVDLKAVANYVDDVCCR